LALGLAVWIGGGRSRPLGDPAGCSPRLEQCGGNLGRAQTRKALRTLALKAACAAPGILEVGRLIITWSRLAKPSSSRLQQHHQHGYIAQWLERLTADQQVPGSNPGVPFFPSHSLAHDSYLQRGGRHSHTFSDGPLALVESQPEPRAGQQRPWNTFSTRPLQRQRQELPPTSRPRLQGPSREQASGDNRQEKLEYAWQLHAQCDAIIPG
jgi:hypothetical protein